MGIPIVSGASSDLWTIDPTSKAGRVSLYGPDGQALVYNSGSDRGIANILVRQTATTGAGASGWAIRSATSGKVLYITKIWLQLAFDGTGAASLMRCELIKGTGCTAMSGGNAVTPLLKRTSITNADVDCRVLDTGLTQTNITQGAAFWTASAPRVTFSATQSAPFPSFVLDFGDKPLELAQNEVLSLRNGPTNASVVGDTWFGGCEFYGG